jgi:outer membrane protein OmpA-like peptidoglycan-associated protein
MTDMTVSFLFIIIILLIFFASQFSPNPSKQDLVPRSEFEKMRVKTIDALKKSAVLTEVNDALDDRVASLEQDVKRLTMEKSDISNELVAGEAKIEQIEAQLSLSKRPEALERYFADVNAARTTLLNRLRDRIIAQNPQIPELSDIVTVENGALRFQSDRGLFAKSVSTLRPDRRALVDSIAETLDEVLPCYTAGPRSRWSATCNADFAMIEAVQIEGHTDSDGADLGNAILAANRALNTYQRMTRGDGASILDHRNLQGQPVLSLAAYGENRPIRPNDGTENKSANRRIDLRFIMVAPQRVEGIDRIRGALREGSVR